MYRPFLPLALILIPLAVACSVSAESSPTSLTSAKPDDRTSGDIDGDTQSGSSSSGTSVTPPVVGSPLCGVSTTSCLPGDDGTRPLGDAPSCATPSEKTQGLAPDASTADYACRVTPKGPPSCPAPNANNERTPNADRNGVDGVSCQTDAECAPGFDCVSAGVGEKTNVCRRYCCSGTCEGVTSQNGGPTFCDVLKMVRSEAAPSGDPLLAPVCMPIKACTLLEDGDCATGETCAIVNDKGTTGCVPVPTGTDVARRGESCEKKHCEAGNTCLGSSGDRTCYKLCRMTGGKECPQSEVCTTGSAFLDTSFGVCKPAP